MKPSRVLHKNKVRAGTVDVVILEIQFRTVAYFLLESTVLF